MFLVDALEKWHDVDKKISQLHQVLVNTYKKKLMCEDGQVALVKCSPIWK